MDKLLTETENRDKIATKASDQKLCTPVFSPGTSMPV